MKSSNEANKSDNIKSGVRFTSGNTLSEREFHDGIKAAEEGVFYSIGESMNRFEEWLKKKEKK